ncbi:MAG: zinc-binding alcohol dehydrogenase family protein [Polyangia bacterium]|jgi:NADPH2:quinone reductase
MRAWLLDRFSGLAGLRLAEVPEPVAGAGEVVLQMHYAALNPADRYLAERQYPALPSLPHILGRDGAGHVVAVGPGVSEASPGDTRIILRSAIGAERPGTFAERVAVPCASLAEVPPGWDEKEAASAPLVYLTAHQALVMWGTLPPRSALLVTGASGGVGVAAVQLGTALGHRVVALSRNPEKRNRLRQLGAVECFDPADPGWPDQVERAISPQKIELAIDNVGGALLSEVIVTLGNLGKVSLVGRLAGPVPAFNTAALFFRRIRLGGVAVGAYTPEQAREAWQEVLGRLALVRARPVLDCVLPFERLPEAFARLASGPMGKVLLEVAR